MTCVSSSMPQPRKVASRALRSGKGCRPVKFAPRAVLGPDRAVSISANCAFWMWPAANAALPAVGLSKSWRQSRMTQSLSFRWLASSLAWIKVVYIRNAPLHFAGDGIRARDGGATGRVAGIVIGRGNAGSENDADAGPAVPVEQVAKDHHAPEAGKDDASVLQICN